MKCISDISRRSLIAGLAGTAFLPFVGWEVFASQLLFKQIPSTGRTIPVIGLGSWITFNVGSNAKGILQSQRVVEAFFQAGGRLIDSSPMYGSSQATIGRSLSKFAALPGFFAADKVWTRGKSQGIAQIKESLTQWRLPRFSLLQVHNLKDWETHLPVLFEMKKRGELDYVGVTTSHGRRHGDVAHILEEQPIDFVQLTYNMTHRSAEVRLLPVAQERGIAVIANRPFDGGRLIRAVKRERFPGWAKAYGFSGWADFLLKFIVSHEAITCAIPATTQVQHVLENMAACRGVLPDEKLRQRMIAYVEAL